MQGSLPITVIIWLLASSCSTYQYGTVSSAKMPMNEKQEFVYENDSLRLVYNFNGPNAPVNITVHNKLQVPLYIDWKKSAVVINDQAVSYVPSELRIEGGVQGSSYNTGTRTNGATFGSGIIDATVSLPPAIDFVPPRSFFTRSPIGLTDRLIENVPESDFHRLKYQAAEGYRLKVKAAVFTEENSPLRFKSYLTLMVGEVTGKPVSYEHSFFLSRLMSTDQPPGIIWLNVPNRGNQFYISRTPSSGAAVAVVFGTMTAGSMAVWADKKSNSSN
ncbi:hypothetical protein [Niastella populi]|uniref:Uncharacterized protein n=1 Tax=Niastella populi TaxID=550983 RepID=A0A1V9FLV1_9BACT|nr:hypothetical protein [Niastella populi]OQP59318.1 hypothetical protein A4R26_21095 [Niastella populi]